MVKQRAQAAIGPSGVVGDGARKQIDRGTWETRRGGGDGLDARREDITAAWPRRESEGPIVAKKRLITVEPRGLTVDMFR